jgi:hypothetical protein
MKTSLYYNNIVSIQKKLANKVLFNKSYLKNSEFFKTSYMLDNYYNTSFFRSKKITNFKPAESINSAPNIFINKLNKEIKFQLYTCIFTKRNSDLEKFYKTLESAKSLSKSFSTLIFLNIVKGGFKCYYFGLIGFLPRTQANKSFQNLVQSIQCTCNLQKFNSFLACFKKSEMNKSLLRVSLFTLNNLCVYPTFKKKLFSGVTKRSRLFFNDINVIFVFKSSR